MLHRFKRLGSDETGVTALEYALIAALIAVVIIGGVSLLGNGRFDRVLHGREHDLTNRAAEQNGAEAFARRRFPVGSKRSVLRRRCRRRRRLVGAVAAFVHELVELGLVLGVAQPVEERAKFLLLFFEPAQRRGAIFVERVVAARWRVAAGPALPAASRDLKPPAGPFPGPFARLAPPAAVIAPAAERAGSST